MSSLPSSCGCSCGAPENLTIVYSCSGAADTGEIADRAARLLNAEGKAKMSCLAGIGGHVSGLMASAEAADSILAIDGCPLDCASKTLKLAGFTTFHHIRVTDLGFVKGKSDTSESSIRKVAEAAYSRL